MNLFVVRELLYVDRIGLFVVCGVVQVQSATGSKLFGMAHGASIREGVHEKCWVDEIQNLGLVGPSKFVGPSEFDMGHAFI